MLAKKQLPQEFIAWNKQYGAPFGHDLVFSKKLKRWLPSTWYWKLRGPFSIQSNNSTRAFEYPWVFQQLQIKPGLRVVDVEGGLSGFQFVLSALGCQVINVDPGLEAAGRGWPCNQEIIAKLNRRFDTDVQLQNTTMDKAAIEPRSIDAVVSISVIEHLSWDDVIAVMKKSWDVLVPGGHFILTVDLFPDIEPFTRQKTNKYGSNINLKNLIELMPFEIEWGDQSQLYGFESFNPESILREQNNLLTGSGYPAFVQTLVLKKNQKIIAYSLRLKNT